MKNKRSELLLVVYWDVVGLHRSTRKVIRHITLVCIFVFVEMVFSRNPTRVFLVRLVDISIRLKLFVSLLEAERFRLLLIRKTLDFLETSSHFFELRVITPYLNYSVL